MTDRLPRLNRRRNNNSLSIVSSIKLGSRRALKEAQEDIRDDETFEFNLTLEDMGAENSPHHDGGTVRVGDRHL